MKKNNCLTIVLIILLGTSITFAQKLSAALILNADMCKDTISKNIYGQFAEHLGHGIYGGIWVGENSTIPNTRGIRNDVLAALKRAQIPNVRWPGGCFADEYHWMDGIGPRDKRPKMINTHWGGVVEDNSFGTHEFLDLCEQLGAEPYISGNVGSGSVEEMSKWVEYITFDGESPMANLRKQNGKANPWRVKYWGIGNENWGCGGNMTAQFYSDLYKRYATYCRNYGANHLFKVASGGYSNQYDWTETLMKNIPGWMMNGISLHSYNVWDWNKKGSATNFEVNDYFTTIEKCLLIDEYVTKHSAIMDKYDPEKKIGLMVDEWGNWWDVEPGTNPGFLYQQNTLRDAITSAINLNIFNTHCARVRMSNIAQMINVLQSLVLTDGPKMVLTPTFYVYEMFKVHHDAALIPVEIKSSEYELNGKKIPAVNVSASKNKKGIIHITLVNVNPNSEAEISCELKGAKAASVFGRVLTAKEISSYNTFENPNEVQSTDFNNFSQSSNLLTVKLPAKSIVMLEIK